MDFNDLLHDIAKLEGLHLSSIRPGADIVVEKVDIEHGKVLVKNASGKLFSRSVIEFQKIWEGLNTEPAVRVEEILRGSGSSRNQPETIMANLPYIEWLKITNKKHISYVGKSSHPYGTLKQMDGMSASKINIPMMKMKNTLLLSQQMISFLKPTPSLVQVVCPRWQLQKDSISILLMIW